jgi:hypothetical protein
MRSGQSDARAPKVIGIIRLIGKKQGNMFDLNRREFGISSYSMSFLVRP